MGYNQIGFTKIQTKTPIEPKMSNLISIGGHGTKFDPSPQRTWFRALEFGLLCMYFYA